MLNLAAAFALAFAAPDTVPPPPDAAVLAEPAIVVLRQPALPIVALRLSLLADDPPGYAGAGHLIQHLLLPRLEERIARVGGRVQAVRTSDGWVTIGCATQSLWFRLLEVIGDEDLRQDPRFVDNAARMGHLQLHLAHIQMHLAILAEMAGDLLCALQYAEDGLAHLEGVEDAAVAFQLDRVRGRIDVRGAGVQRVGDDAAGLHRAARGGSHGTCLLGGNGCAVDVERDLEGR
mgnify:CR=1 FL=1